MIVMKFGGTSVGSADAILRVCHIIQSRIDQRPVIITSAAGGVTNKLVTLTRVAGSGEAATAMALIDEILAQHHDIVDKLGLNQDKALATVLETGAQMLQIGVHNILKTGSLTDELYDAVISMGEFFMANMLPAILRSNGIKSQFVDARTLLRTDSAFGTARPLVKESKQLVEKHLLPVIQNGTVAVIQGFIGSTDAGKTTTLGRGGSDFSATLFGAMLGVETVEIWSDVDGVLTADPSLVPEAHRIRHMSFQEAAELAYFGAKVLHPATLLPAVENDMTVVVLNSMNIEFPGTAISKTSPVEPYHEGQVKSIAYKEGLTVITVMSSRMLMAHGFMAKLFAIFEKYETAVDLVSTSEVTVSLTVDNTKNLHKILSELEDIAYVKVEKDRAIVCLVGEGLSRTKGIPGQIFGLLQDTHIYSISQGASEINLSFVIDDDNLPKVITRLHDYFFSGELDPHVFAV